MKLLSELLFSKELMINGLKKVHHIITTAYKQTNK